MSDFELLSSRDAGVRLGLTSAGIRRLSDAGELRTVRDSTGRRLFFAEDVEKLRQQRMARRPARRA